MRGSEETPEEDSGATIEEAITDRKAGPKIDLVAEDRSNKAVLKPENGGEAEMVDLRNAKELDKQVRKTLLGNAMETRDMDNELFLQKIKDRLDRVGVKLPEVEVVFRNVSVGAEAFVANRVLPSIPNYFLDMAEQCLRLLHLAKQSRQQLSILKDVSGRLEPGRFTLLLGPPGSGKSTLLKLLAGKLQGSNLEINGDITYNGHSFKDFIVQRTAAYIEQSDDHLPQLSVRETLDFAARCQGAGFDEIALLREKEKELGIEPDWSLDAFMKAAAHKGKRESIMTDYILRMLGLEICEDTVVGDQLVRGISGGQKKRVTTGEMLVSPKRIFFADEISTGLDSSTTFQIVRCFRNLVKTRQATVLMSLLQPPPETFKLFDDVMLLAEGRIVYHGPCDFVLEFFEELGFRLPDRKGVADFLQEVTSKKDQRQFWKGRPRAYRFVTVPEIAAAFEEFHVGQKRAELLRTKVLPNEEGMSGLVSKRFALSWSQSLKACMRREWSLMRHNSFLYLFRLGQVSLVAFMMATLFVKPRMNTDTFAGGTAYLQLLFFSVYFMVVTNFSELAISVNQLSVFWKQRDNLFFPTECHVLPTTILRVPYSVINVVTWSVIVYWPVGLTYSAGRFFIFLCINLLCHTVSVTQFRAISSITRTLVLANIVSFLVVLMAFLFGGLIIAKRDVPPWWRWAVWVSPIYYAQKSVSINEFHAPRWNQPDPSDPSLGLGRAVLDASDLDSYGAFIAIGAGALLAYVVVYNIVIVLAMKFLSSPDSKKAVMPATKLAGEEGSTHSQAVSQRSLELEADRRASAEQAASQRSLNGNSIRSLPPPSASQSSLRDATQDTEGGSSGGPGAKQAVQREEGLPPRRPGGGLLDEEELVEENEGGMTLPFLPMLLTFTDICYFVDMPSAMSKAKNTRRGKSSTPTPRKESSFRSRPQLQLLNDIDGVFAPGVLTALMGATGAGKTTLMDVLAGRKTSGKVTGKIKVNGFPQDLRTFKRVSGYCEQFDIHSPQCTVHEALWFSARLRLAPEVATATRKAFMQEIMDLVELTVIKDALVGRPGVSGLSVEQRKRLTIAVELVANPSIVFMDEPTSGLDARAAAIVMRIVRNICSTGRTICCTIHQPSIDVFEAFDELVLLKPGGAVIYSGSLGTFSADMVAYFESIPGVPRIPADTKDFNPATWMLDISTVSAEQKLGLDLAEVYRSSSLYRHNRARIDQKSHPAPGAQPLAFETEYPQPIWKQYFILLAKNSILYYRNPSYTAVRLLFTFLLALVFGTALWGKGQERSTREALERVAATQYLVVVFYGFTNSAAVQPVVSYERLVFYRERFAGMYSSIPYAFAQGDVEAPYLIVQATLYSVVTYWLIRYEYSAAKFFWYLLFMLLSLAYYSFYGMMVVSLTDTIATASTVSVIAYAVWNLLAGFIIPKPDVPGWWVWALYLNPAHWSFYGLVVGQLGDVTTTVEAGDGSEIPANEYVDMTYGLRHSFIGWVAAILVGFVIFFRAVTIFALCRFTFGKR